MARRKQRWLVSYACINHSLPFSEDTWEGTLGEWRIEHMKYEDGPYILINAFPLSDAEWEKLNGWVG